MNSIPRIRIPGFISQQENVRNAIKNNELVYGSSLEDFGSQLKRLFSKKHICLCNSGNSALFLSLKALGLNNKKVLIPAIGTCFAIENAVLSTNNIPVYCDINNEDGNLNTEIARLIFLQQKYDVIISPNYFGNVSNIEELRKIGVPIIEDCAQSFLSNIKHKTNSDIQVLSFYPTKVINAIDGGAIITDNKELITKVNDLIYYGHQETVDKVPRMNLKMNNINAAFGIGTLKHLDEIDSFYLSLKKEISEVVNDFKSVDYLQNSLKNTLYKFVLKFNSREAKEIFNIEMQKNHIETSEVFLCVSDGMGIFNETNTLIRNTISIPFYYSLNENEISYVKNKLRDSLQKACGL